MKNMGAILDDIGKHEEEKIKEKKAIFSTDEEEEEEDENEEFLKYYKNKLSSDLSFPSLFVY